MLYPLSHALAPPCLLAARLAFPYLVSSHLIGHRLACLLPALRHGWAGRETGSILCPACLVLALRSVPMPIAGSCRSPAIGASSRSARLRGAITFSSHPCGMCCDVLLACGSPRPSLRLSSRRSGRFFGFSLRLTTRWAGRRADAVVLFVSLRLSRSPCLLASGRFSPSI